MVSKGQDKEILIIGSGLAGMLSACFLSKLAPFAPNITLISTPELPAASHNSTALLSSFGVRSGLGSLGDLLFEAWQNSENFYNSWPVKGVYPSVHYVLPGQGDLAWKKFTRRYGDKNPGEPIKVDAVEISSFYKVLSSYQIDTNLFFESINSIIDTELKDKNGSFKQISTEVESIEADKVRLTCKDGTEYSADAMIVCPGAWREKCLGAGNSKIVGGGFYTFEGVDLGPKSFVVSVDGKNVQYRHWRKDLVVGSLSWPGIEVDLDSSELEKIYNWISEKIEFPKLPEWSEQKKWTQGYRLKGPKRMPIAKSIDDNARVYEISGLYKNGLTLAPLLAAKISQNVIDRLT